MARTFDISVYRNAPKASQIYEEVRDQVRVGLRRIGKLHVESRNRIVADWSNKPDFEYEVGSGPKKLYVRVQATGAAKAVKIWNWIDKTGTKPHTIYPQRKKVLSFPWAGPGSYVPKTRANPARYGGAGQVKGGDRVAFRYVKHPGFPPRKFSEAINRDLESRLHKEIENGYRRGLRRARR